MTEGSAMIRVLLVDDQELIRTGLRGILRPQFGFDIVGECADGGRKRQRRRATTYMMSNMLTLTRRSNTGKRRKAS